MRIWSKKISLRITPIPTQPKRMHGLLRRFFCMSKKNLNADGLLNELKGGSSFFPVRHSEPIQKAQQFSASQPVALTSQEKKEHHDTMIPRYHDTMIPSNHTTMIPLTEEGILEAVRKAVKQVGKEAATQRLTLEEKQNLKTIEYTYMQQGILTSSNEIIRIATNYIVRDHQKNGEKSILAKVLRQLNS